MHSFQLRARLRNNGLWIASAISVLLIFHICYGLKTLVPTNISWLMTVMHDWGQHYLGFHFFKNEPWHFPLGKIDNFFSPLGTNIGYTDSIPLLGLLFKIVAPLLPEDFQYFGAWLLLCHLLAAYFTIRIFRLFGVKDLYTFLAVVFIAANPVLVYRGLHLALCGHWLFLAAIYLYFQDPARVPARTLLRHQFLLLLVAGLVNPYICFMVLGFTLILPVKHCFFDKAIGKKYLAAYLAVSVGALLLAWYTVGLLTFGNKEDIAVHGGFGLYAMNLNSLWNPWEFSAFIPDRGVVSPRQYEGFMYMGVGLLALLVLAAGLRAAALVRGRKTGTFSFWRASAGGAALLPLLLLLVGYALFAITNVVTLNRQVLFTVPLPEAVIRFGEIFRASARFFWVPYYILVFYILITVAKSPFPRWVKTAVLAAALLLQLYDTKLLLTYRTPTYGTYTPPIDTDSWNALIGQFDEIVLYPPFEANYRDNMDYQYFCYLAAKARKPITTGYVARVDYAGMRRYNDSLKKMLDNADIPPRTLFITVAPYLGNFSLALQTHACRLNLLDRYFFLYSAENHNQQVQAISNRVNAQDPRTLDSARQALSIKVQFRPYTAPLPAKPADSVQYAMERFAQHDNFVSLDGWAYPGNWPGEAGDSILFLLDGPKPYAAAAFTRLRPDVNSYFNKPDLKDIGFNGHLFTENVEKGKYRLLVAVKKADGRLAVRETDKFVKVGIPDFVHPRKAEAAPAAGLPAQGRVESLEQDKNCYIISGWAFLNNQSTDDIQISLYLKKGGEQYRVATEPVFRNDISGYFKTGYNLDKAGFTVKFSRDSLPKGTYEVGILVQDGKSNKNTLLPTEKQITAL